MPSRSGQLTRSIISRRIRRTREIDKAPATEHPSSSTAPLIFESLEPRLLLAADPLGISAGYAFNEVSGTTTADASGNGITGTLVNGPTFTTAGKYGNAVALDGINDYVNLGNPTALQLTGSMTVSAWIYASSFPVDDAAIVSKRTADRCVGFQLDTTVDTRHAHDRVQADQQLRRTDVPLRRNDAAAQHLVLRHRRLQRLEPNHRRLSQRSARQRRVAGHRHRVPAEFDGQRHHRPSCGFDRVRILRPHRRRADRQSRVDAGSDPNRHGDAAWCRTRPRYGCAFGSDWPRSDPRLDNANQSVLERLDRQCRRHRLSGVPQRPANCDHHDDQLQQHRADTRDDLSICRQGLRRGWKHVRANYSCERDDAGPRYHRADCCLDSPQRRHAPVGHRRRFCQRLGQCRRRRRAIPAGRCSTGRRGHHHALQRELGHYHCSKRQPCAARARARRRRQFDQFHAAHRHGLQYASGRLRRRLRLQRKRRHDGVRCLGAWTDGHTRQRSHLHHGRPVRQCSGISMASTTM